MASITTGRPSSMALGSVARILRRRARAEVSQASGISSVHLCKRPAYAFAAIIGRQGFSQLLAFLATGCLHVAILAPRDKVFQWERDAMGAFRIGESLLCPCSPAASRGTARRVPAPRRPAILYRRERVGRRPGRSNRFRPRRCGIGTSAAESQQFTFLPLVAKFL